MILIAAISDPLSLPQGWIVPVAALIPVVIAAMTHPSAPSSLRQMLAWGGVAIVAVLEQITGPSFTIEGLLMAAFMAGVTQLGVYLSTDKIVDINSSVLKTKGIGASQPKAGLHG